MADGVTIKVDATSALAKLSPSTGIPEQVRKNLRALLPDLTRRVGAQVESNLDSRLKSRRTLEVKKELVESPNYIYGRVRLVANPPSPSFLPDILESGARAHLIQGNPILSFFWDKVGKQVFFPQVNHPGFSGTQSMKDAFDSMQSVIRSNLEDSVFGAVRGIR
jgi:hypothetical protein